MKAFKAADPWLIIKCSRWPSGKGDVILTCIVANTLHISKRAKATANTAPITLRITNSALISDGQSEGRKKNEAVELQTCKCIGGLNSLLLQESVAAR